MSASREAAAHRAGPGPDLASRWITLLADGYSADELKAEISAMAISTAMEGIRSLGHSVEPVTIPFLAQLGTSAHTEIAQAAVETLGQIRSSEAAEELDKLATAAVGKSVQKAARRSLYRLASQSIHPSAGYATPVVVSTQMNREATLYRVVASSVDGSGTRSIWFAAERPLGGIFQIAVTVNDVEGLTDCTGRDTTRKRFAEQETRMRGTDPMAWVELPIDYARQIVDEAVTIARGSRQGVPAGYAPWADLIGNPAEPLKEALVYQELRAVEVRLHPTLQGEAPQLFEQAEVESWFFPPSAVQKWLKELTSVTTSRLLITPETDESRAQRVIRDAVKELFTPNVLRGLKRRLEETAYIFLRTDREADARRALAAAVTISDPRPLQPPHPFLYAMVQRSLNIAALTQRMGGEPPRLARVP